MTKPDDKALWMTNREYFAAACLQGILSGRMVGALEDAYQDKLDEGKKPKGDINDAMAFAAVKLADKLIIQLNVNK